MNIKKITKIVLKFTINRLIEILGTSVSLIGFLLFIALISYSPDDPNFIFPENTEIKNFLGFQGSYISDLFFQSIGIMSYLVSISLFITGINMFRGKNIFLIIENNFYIILYCIFGTIFLNFFYKNTFELYINGNGGFVGEYFVDSFFVNLINFQKTFSYYFLILITIGLFLISVNFNYKKFLLFLKKIFNFISRKNTKSYTDKSEIISEYIPQDEIKNLIQEDLPFIKAEKMKENEKTKFKLPNLDLLNTPSKKEREETSKVVSYDPEFLEKILLDFGVNGSIKKVSHGPVVTLNEFEPAAGVKVSKIINLSDDIARNTSSESARIATIPGSNTVGIELPNNLRENVYLSEILDKTEFKKKDIKLPIALGKNISGTPVVGDLASMPHLLIAGTTGSGKSVCINTIILSLLYKHTPEKCKFILIDPKMLELSTYEGIPHLICPVITEAKKAASVLGWVVKEMESRYRLMTKEGVRNIDSYNVKHKLPMPYIVVVVDEMSDLMLVAGKEIENYIQKLSQMARAAGIHIIMATQRPSVDVITGTIKANFPTRISFQVTSKIDSRTILGEQGAEQLLGKGDMLYMSSANKILRIHAPFVSDNEIEKINNFIRSQQEPDYVDEILNFADEKEIGDGLKNNNDKDELYETALEIIKSEGKASTSFLQRKLQIGYNRAARIIDMMESEGVVSKANHVGKRDVL
ncbi:DNA translocase FtsK [Candidatus Pelagibacter communis]|uniref:DNA translocase FtsK n=1 Tax=Pelagibacter ubique TaxID=198252 RepID=UPI00094DE5B3|tara:strand:- start:1482 stop:3572 length:2091 start_codon:yes stop_codon:yes gene_type:complete